MSCFYPLWRKISFTGEIVKVPCGRCRGCRMDRAKTWALRCVHEASLHEQNCFVTLTYNKECLPSDGSIDKREVQLFMKRLRKSAEPLLIRFYACGEYGEEKGRPHYHLILFGYDFPDKELLYVQAEKGRWSLNSSPYKVYKSELLGSLWTKGFSTIGEVNLQSCGYCARYISKKIGGEKAKEVYQGKEPEFCLMSRRPGIGSAWFDRYCSDVYPKDFTTVDGKKFKPPKYYDHKLMRKNWPMYMDVKEERIKRTENPDILRRQQKEKYLVEVTKSLRREYENGE